MQHMRKSLPSGSISSETSERFAAALTFKRRGTPTLLALHDA